MLSIQFLSRMQICLLIMNCQGFVCFCNFQYHNRTQSDESQPKTENSSFQKGLGAIASSLNYIGNAFEVTQYLKISIAYPITPLIFQKTGTFYASF